LVIRGRGFVGIYEGETCPAGFGSGKHTLRGWLGQVRLG